MLKKSLEVIASEDARYNVMALKFVYEGLGETIQRIREEQADQYEKQHISGGELSKGLAKLALARWGRLTRVVLEHWGVKTTRDFGEIVYLMIKHHWMTSQTSDRIEDFDNVYDFKTAFEDQFKFELPDQIT